MTRAGPVPFPGTERKGPVRQKDGSISRRSCPERPGLQHHSSESAGSRPVSAPAAPRPSAPFGSRQDGATGSGQLRGRAGGRVEATLPPFTYMAAGWERACAAVHGAARVRRRRRCRSEPAAEARSAGECESGRERGDAVGRRGRAALVSLPLLGAGDSWGEAFVLRRARSSPRSAGRLAQRPRRVPPSRARRARRPRPPAPRGRGAGRGPAEARAGRPAACGSRRVPAVLRERVVLPLCADRARLLPGPPRRSVQATRPGPGSVSRTPDAQETLPDARLRFE